METAPKKRIVWPAVMTAKFKLVTLTHHATGTQDSCHAVAKFAAVTQGEDNLSWSKWTPSGELSMAITNPDAVKALVIGEEYFLDFRPAAG